MLKLAIFDMDGLIFNTERLFMDELDTAMAKHGYKLTLDVYLELLGVNEQSCKDRMKKIYGEDYPFHEISDEARMKLNKKAIKGLPVKDGIRELLAELKKSGIKTAVASSTPAEYVKMYLKTSNLDEMFDTVIGGDMVSRSKPAPDIFLLACEKAGALSSEAVVFEDSENGIKAAYNGNIDVICIPDMKQHGNEIRSLCCAYVKDGFEAIEYLKSKNMLCDKN